jgi:cell division protein FtsW (lipid II flippase)
MITDFMFDNVIIRFGFLGGIIVIFNFLLIDFYLIRDIKNINEKLISEDFEQRKILCKTLIEKIVVDDENIDIHYKI